MRASVTISAVVLLGISLAGCDMPASHQQQAAATPPCNCTTAPPATVTPPPGASEHLTRFSYAPRHHFVRHRYYAQAPYRPAYYRSRHAAYRGRYEIDSSQDSVDAYDYASASRITRRYSSENEYAGAYEGGYSSGYRSRRVVWVDGYGRGYFSNGPVTVAATMRGKRLDAYHGYDADCPGDGEPH